MQTQTDVRRPLTSRSVGQYVDIVVLPPRRLTPSYCQVQTVDSSAAYWRGPLVSRQLSNTRRKAAVAPDDCVWRHSGQAIDFRGIGDLGERLGSRSA